MCTQQLKGIGGRLRHFAWAGALAIVLAWARPVAADIIVPGADGSDEELTPTGNIEIDLSRAITRSWDTSSPVPGRGVYDPAKWAVVFKYTYVTIPAGVTVTFKNHPSRVPVVWLVSGNVNIAGTLKLDGKNGTAGSPVTFAEPGPGGFRGGAGRLSAGKPRKWWFWPRRCTQRRLLGARQLRHSRCYV